jgi:hypothetical protein
VVRLGDGKIVSDEPVDEPIKAGTPRPSDMMLSETLAHAHPAKEGA